MAPRKNIEKVRVKPLQIKATKGVRKKNCATTPAKKRLKVTSKVEMCPTVKEDQITQNVSPKKATQRKKKNDLIASDDTSLKDNPTVSPSKSRAKPVKKQKKHETKSVPIIEDSIVDECNSPIVSPRARTKTNQKQNSNTIKIMLANEVVKSAFQKKPTKANVEINNIASCEEFIKSRSGRRRMPTPKLMEYVFDSRPEPTNALENNEQIQDVAKKKPLKVGIKKRAVAVETPLGDDQTHTKLDTDITIKNATTDEVPKKRKRLSLKRKVTPDQAVGPKKRQRLSIKKSKENTETKSDVTEINTNSTPQKTTLETNGHISEKGNTCGRKSSITSTSTSFSWTKDISSSSAVTCITVQSNDFVRIDEKMPFIKLVNVERQLKYTNDKIFNDLSFESTSKRKTSECSSTISTVNLSNSHALNLSTSSLTSVTTNKPGNKTVKEKEGNNENAVEKLRRNLDSLSSKMKNFDLEIINWIGYDNEIKDVATLDYDARIFEVLKEENEIMKYCKEIKKVLSGDVDQRSEVPESGHKKSKTIEVRELEHNTSPKQTLTKPNYEEKAEPSTDIAIQKDVIPDKEISNFIAPNTSSQVKDNRLKKLDSKNENNPNSSTVTRSEGPETSNNSKSVQKVLNNSQIEHTDDDDAISLYAESITGWETSKRSNITNCSIEAVDDNTREIRNPQSNEPDDHDDHSLESGEYVDSPISNEMYEERPTQSDINKTMPDRNISNQLNVREIQEKSTISPSNIQGLKKLNTSTDPRKSYNNQVREFMRKFDKFNKNHSIQVRVPFNTDASSSRQFQIIGNNDSPIQNTDTKGVNGPVLNNSRTTDIANSINKSMLAAGNFSFQSEQPKVQSPHVTSNKQFQNKGSLVFNGCIFNFADKCKKKICFFPHVTIEDRTLTAILQGLSKEAFVKECLYLTSWPVLIPKYGLHFVRECVCRKISNLLLRMILDFILKVRHKEIVMQATEITLLYLNDVDLMRYYEILQYGVGCEMWLCDYFMQVISETQNFSRFKTVFIKLTLFMCQIGRTFKLNVASQLLERVFILGYDDILAAALIFIVEKTDPQIFAVPMMSSFEKKLCANNTELYEQLMGLKLKAGLGAVLLQAAQQLPSAPQSSTPTGRVESPVTSKESPSNKSEPAICRSVTLNRPANMASSDSSEEVVNRNFMPNSMKQRWQSPARGYGMLRPLRPPRPLQPSWHPPRKHNVHRQLFCRQPPPGC